MKFNNKLMFGSALLLVFSSALYSCASKPMPGEISGNIKNFKEGYVYFDEVTVAATTPKDSVKPDSKGNFKFKFTSTEPTFFRLRLTSSNYVLLLLDKNDEVTFSCDANNLMGTAQVKGSVESSKLFEATSLMQSNAQKLDSLNNVFTQNQENPAIDSIKFALQQVYEKLMDEEKEYVKKFIDKNSSSLAGLAIIDKLPPEEYIEYYEKLDAGLTKALPENSYTKMFHSRVSELNRISIGSEAPEITLNTPDGKTIALSSLRGKVVLIDFWASWCRPCRAENPNVVKMYNTYKDKGFDIYSVSLDKEKDAWVKAIADDNLSWPSHVSDLGFWQSSVVKLYNISGIPFTCLLDKEGKVAAKGLRGDELEAKVKELLAK